MSYRFLVCLMNLTGFYNLACLTALLKLCKKDGFFFPAHVAMFAVMTHAYDCFNAFLLIPFYNTIDACRVESSNLSCNIAAHPIHRFKLKSQQPLCNVHGMLFLLSSEYFCQFRFAKLRTFSSHGLHLISLLIAVTLYQVSLHIGSINVLG